MQNSKFKIIFHPLAATHQPKRKKRPRRPAEIAFDYLIIYQIATPSGIKNGVKIA